MDKVYVVFGFMNTGSGSLTYPEDFEFEGFYDNEKDAQGHIDRLNGENGVDEDGEWDENHEDEDDDYDGMVYQVEEVKNLKG